MFTLLAHYPPFYLCLLCSTDGVHSLMLEDGKNDGSKIRYILRVSLEEDVKCGPVEGRAKSRSCAAGASFLKTSFQYAQGQGFSAR